MHMPTAIAVANICKTSVARPVWPTTTARHRAVGTETDDNLLFVIDDPRDKPQRHINIARRTGILWAAARPTRLDYSRAIYM